jgi:hypothetical protein
MNVGMLVLFGVLIWQRRNITSILIHTTHTIHAKYI